MGSFIFRCPHANLNVQEFALNSNDTAAVFEPIVCTASAQVHLINAKTGEVLTGTLSCEQAKADLKRGGQGTGSYVDTALACSLVVEPLAIQSVTTNHTWR